MDEQKQNISLGKWLCGISTTSPARNPWVKLYFFIFLPDSSLRNILGLGRSHRCNSPRFIPFESKAPQTDRRTDCSAGVARTPKFIRCKGPNFALYRWKPKKIQHNPTCTNCWPPVSYMTTHRMSTAESRTWRYQTLKHLSYLEARKSNHFLGVHCMDLLGSQTHIFCAKFDKSTCNGVLDKKLGGSFARHQCQCRLSLNGWQNVKASLYAVPPEHSIPLHAVNAFQMITC